MRKLTLAFLLITSFLTAQNQLTPAKLEAIRNEIITEVEKRHDQTAQINDMIFSFGELGFQEVESSAYLTQLLEKEGFKIEKNISGIPTAWIAKWGNGKPIIALGSDVDCIPKASQKPGVAYHDPLVEGAPGHGEGHNSGQALNITSALVIKKIMEREKLSGTLMRLVSLRNWWGLKHFIYVMVILRM